MPSHPTTNRLPIEDVLPALSKALEASGHALLTAPPGAGKTTRVPLALLDAPWLLGRKLLLLEPRRLAARAAAHRMAGTLGEPIGSTVGYRMRLDTKVGPTTRLEVVTEGILTRLLQQDPSLSEYGLVIFDEFHERSLHADAGLALCLETRRLFHPELRVLVMSATLDCGAVGDLLGQAPVISCAGRMFPVDTRYVDAPLTDPLEKAVVRMIHRALARDDGSLLVFLPGMAEIRRVERTLLAPGLGPTVCIAPLHGDLPQDLQDAAIAPAPPGKRKVVLATSIAETSITIEGIRVVIDAGLSRIPRFDPRTGLTKLDTVRVSQDSADQRRGRAGRLEPGVCYRLWTEQEHRSLPPRRQPEIHEADLAPLILDLASWGTTNPSDLLWLTPPPSGAVSQAKDLLRRLDALSAEGQLTDHGRRMAELPLHPRLSHMLLKSVPLCCIDLACDLAALLSERDIVRQPTGVRPRDLRLRLDALHGTRDHCDAVSVDGGVIQRVKRTADLWRKQLARFAHTSQSKRQPDTDQVGCLLALAYPDRIAQRQKSADARYLLANGRGAMFTNPDPLGSEPYLVLAALDAGSQWARIDLAAPVSLDDVERLYRDQIIETDMVGWDEKSESVRATRVRRLDSLVLSEKPLSKPEPLTVVETLLERVRHAGLAVLDWTPELQQWRARVQFLRRTEGPDSGWPDLSDENLIRTLDQWLGPALAGIMTLDRMRRLDLSQPLYTWLTWEQRRELDRLAPTHFVVPSGSKIRISYESQALPVLAVRLQEMFGCRDTPRVAGGRIPVMLHLLSPAKRPVQVTKDLASFWKTAYQEVRKELRGRYPNHHWPEDPLTALPTAKTKRHKP